MDLLTNEQIDKLSLADINRYISAYQTELNTRMKELRDIERENRKIAEEGLTYMKAQAGKLGQFRGLNGTAEFFDVQEQKDLAAARAKLRGLRNTLASYRSSVASIKLNWQKRAEGYSKRFGTNISVARAIEIEELFSVGREYNVPSEVVKEIQQLAVANLKNGDFDLEDLIRFMKEKLGDPDYDPYDLVDDYIDLFEESAW